MKMAIQSETSFSLVVIHPGAAHLDEFLSVGLVAHRRDRHHLWPAPVERRDPTAEELGDPSVWVLDCGGVHDPDKRNYDHHQLPRGTEECTFSLLCKEFGYHDLFLLRPWYRTMIEMDAIGPFEVAKRLGLGENPIQTFASLNPVQACLLSWWADGADANGGVVPPELVTLARNLFGRRLAEAKAFSTELEEA